MSDGHRTSTIPRPAAAGVPVSRVRRRKRAKPARTKQVRAKQVLVEAAPSDEHIDSERNGLLKDFTTPIPRAKQIVTDGHGRLIVGVFAALIAIAIGAALFVLPVKSWMKQRDTLATRTAELETLDAANAQLQGQVDRLQTPDGVREAVREEIDYVPEGEERVTVLPVGPASTVLPDGWPYNLVSSIVALRTAEAAANAAAAATTVAPVAPASVP